MIENKVVLRPVRTDQRGDAPRQSGERSLVHGEQAAEALGDVLDLEQASATVWLRWRPFSEQSAMQAGEDAGDAPRREGDDEDQHSAVDDEIETGAPPVMSLANSPSILTPVRRAADRTPSRCRR